MPDKFGKEVRSRIMRQIRGRDTGPEMAVRSFLHRQGFRFRLHRADLPGKPDVVLPKFKAVVFVHGCFWHQHPGCVHTGVPLSNRRYWKPKLNRTVARDQRHQETLAEAGWHVFVIWECEVTPARLRRLAGAVRKLAHR
jgi:DNA mismatch endonuclease (patch repair protein)